MSPEEITQLEVSADEPEPNTRIVIRRLDRTETTDFPASSGNSN
ncbi:hypothetical protein [Nonomuraea sp. NPDC046570]